ncbi:MAG: transposase, partial [Verrucomicrobia bacterium]|nr:transposase [Verrucomicrobiota bacterium]
MVRDLSCGPLRIFLELEIRRVACDQCGVKRQRLSWLADCPFYTKGFAYYVGRRCRDSTLRFRPIWFGGKDRSEESMEMFYQWLGPKRPESRELLAANRRLHVAYLLKESFGQLWSYRSEGWALR